MVVLLNKNSFHCIGKQPHFELKQTSARIDYLRQDERLVEKKGTLSVKILAEKFTKIDELTSWQVSGR